jgi:hypothetical protein
MIKLLKWNRNNVTTFVELAGGSQLGQGGCRRHSAAGATLLRRHIIYGTIIFISFIFISFDLIYGMTQLVKRAPPLIPQQVRGVL